MDDLKWDSCTGFEGSLRAKVAGGKVCTVLYYFTILVALVLFASSAYSIIAPVVQGETVTSVETAILEEIVWPVIFGCLSPEISEAIRKDPKKTEISIGPLHFIANLSMCPANTGVLVNGRFEKLKTVRSSCLPLTTGESASTADKAILTKISAAFGSEVCFLMNTVGTFKSTPTVPRELFVTIKQNRPLNEEALYGIIGIYSQGSSPFNSNGDLTASYYRVGAQNTLTTIGLEVDTIVDKRQSSFVPIPSNPVIKTKADKSNLYTLTTTTTTKYYQAINSTASAPLITKELGAESDYLFYINSFTSRTITLRKRSFSEVWALLGGALTSALVIITWVFREEVVKKPDGDDTAKVQVFRYQPNDRATQSAVNLVRREATEVASKAAATTGNGTADDIPIIPLTKAAA